jgi:hypothetical protein
MAIAIRTLAPPPRHTARPSDSRPQASNLFDPHDRVVMLSSLVEHKGSDNARLETLYSVLPTRVRLGGPSSDGGILGARQEHEGVHPLRVTLHAFDECDVWPA